jgi:AmmeMemoRadiSam system protein A
MSLGKKERAYLLKLARSAVGFYLKEGKAPELKPGEVPHRKLVENGACFVTLHHGGKLRGCIGTLEAHRPLVFDVIDNALNAALGDPRFQAVSLEELPDVKFSISVLTAPKRLPVKGSGDLLGKLKPHKDGLTVRCGYACATFLPVVWKEIPAKRDFLSQLCMKAGLAPNAWMDTREMEFYTYEAEEFSE